MKILTASAQEIQAIAEKVNKYKFIIHPGETESIALMLRPQFEELVFCTADSAAVKAAHLFGMLTRVVSLEYCLGRSMKTKLPFKCTEKKMDYLKAEAIQYFGVTK